MGARSALTRRGRKKTSPSPAAGSSPKTSATNSNDWQQYFDNTGGILDATLLGETSKTYIVGNPYTSNNTNTYCGNWNTSPYTTSSWNNNITYTPMWQAPPWATWALFGEGINPVYVFGGCTPYRDPDLGEKQVIYGDGSRTIVEWL